jgi:hypothetical protein
VGGNQMAIESGRRDDAIACSLQSRPLDALLLGIWTGNRECANYALAQENDGGAMLRDYLEIGDERHDSEHPA